MSNASLRIRKAAVLGAGVMGAQIAAHLANAGVETLLFDLPAKDGDKNSIVNKAIANLAKQVLSREQIAGLASDADPADWQAKVLETFISPDGALKSIPASRKKRWAVLAWLVRLFEDGRRYTEAEINARLLERHWDSATLRREFIGYKMMAREAGIYWRLPEQDWVSETA